MGEQVICLLVLSYDAATAINAMIASRGLVTPLGTKTYHALAPQYLVKSRSFTRRDAHFFCSFTATCILGS